MKENRESKSEERFVLPPDLQIYLGKIKKTREKKFFPSGLKPRQFCPNGLRMMSWYFFERFKSFFLREILTCTVF